VCKLPLGLKGAYFQPLNLKCDLLVSRICFLSTYMIRKLAVYRRYSEVWIPPRERTGAVRVVPHARPPGAGVFGGGGRTDAAHGGGCISRIQLDPSIARKRLVSTLDEAMK
jgi:hypothetical protein